MAGMSTTTGRARALPEKGRKKMKIWLYVNHKEKYGIWDKYHISYEQALCMIRQYTIMGYKNTYPWNNKNQEDTVYTFEK